MTASAAPRRAGADRVPGLVYLLAFLIAPPEGLSPIEDGEQLHERTTEPHQPAASSGGSRHSRTVQIGEALLLS